MYSFSNFEWLVLEKNCSSSYEGLSPTVPFSLTFHVSKISVNHWGHMLGATSLSLLCGATPGGHVHAGSLLVPNNSHQETPTCHSHEFYCLHAGLPLLETIAGEQIGCDDFQLKTKYSLTNTLQVCLSATQLWPQWSRGEGQHDGCHDEDQCRKCWNYDSSKQSRTEENKLEIQSKFQLFSSCYFFF